MKWDYALHLIVAFLITTPIIIKYPHYTKKRNEYLLCMVALLFIKEIHDVYSYGTFSTQDIAYGIFGMALAKIIWRVK